MDVIKSASNQIRLCFQPDNVKPETSVSLILKIASLQVGSRDSRYFQQQLGVSIASKYNTRTLTFTQILIHHHSDRDARLPLRRIGASQISIPDLSIHLVEASQVGKLDLNLHFVEANQVSELELSLRLVEVSLSWSSPVLHRYCTIIAQFYIGRPKPGGGG